jgi:transcriptional antiterminator NusG
MEKQWFVLHTLSGPGAEGQGQHRAPPKVEEMEDLVGDVLIPTEKVSEVKRGKKTTTTRKFYPGYVLVNMAPVRWQQGPGRQDLVLRPEHPGHH